MSARAMPTATTMPATVPVESEFDLEEAVVELEVAGLAAVGLGVVELVAVTFAKMDNGVEEPK